MQIIASRRRVQRRAWCVSRRRLSSSCSEESESVQPLPLEQTIDTTHTTTVSTARATTLKLQGSDKSLESENHFTQNNNFSITLHKGNFHAKKGYKKSSFRLLFVIFLKRHFFALKILMKKFFSITSHRIFNFPSLYTKDFFMRKNVVKKYFDYFFVSFFNVTFLL